MFLDGSSQKQGECFPFYLRGEKVWLKSKIGAKVAAARGAEICAGTLRAEQPCV